MYFSDSSHWLSRAVPKSKRRDFMLKLQDMLEQLSGPIVLICGQNKSETGSKEEKKIVSAVVMSDRLSLYYCTNVVRVILYRSINCFLFSRR